MILKIATAFFAFGFGVSAFTNTPPLDAPAPQATATLVALALYIAYRAGQKHRYDQLYREAHTAAMGEAQATAHAWANQQVALHLHTARQDEQPRERRDLDDFEEQWTGQGNPPLEREELAELVRDNERRAPTLGPAPTSERSERGSDTRSDNGQPSGIPHQLRRLL